MMKNDPESVYLRFMGPNDSLSTVHDTNDSLIDQSGGQHRTKTAAMTSLEYPYSTGGGSSRGGGGSGGSGSGDSRPARRTLSRPMSGDPASAGHYCAPSPSQVFDALMKSSMNMAIFNTGSTDKSLEEMAEEYLKLDLNPTAASPSSPG